MSLSKPWICLTISPSWAISWLREASEIKRFTNNSGSKLALLMSKGLPESLELSFLEVFDLSDDFLPTTT